MLALVLSLDPKSHIHILQLRYSDENCATLKTSDTTEELAAAGACGNNADTKAQEVTCMASTDTSKFVMDGKTFKMETKVYGQADDCITGDPTITESVYKAGDCIPSPKTAATWVKIPLYACGSGAALTGSTYLICVLLLTLQLSSFLICAGVGSLS